MMTPSYQQLGNNAFSQGHYTKALQYYQKALGDVRGDPDLVADLYGNIGNVYSATGQIKKAIHYYQKTIEILRREEDYGRLGTTFANIGNLYADQEEYTRAIQFYKKALLLLEKEKKWDELSTLYGNLSLLSLKQSHHQAALDYAEKGLTHAKRLKHPRRLADIMHRLAKVKGTLGRVEESQRLSEGAYTLYAQLQDEIGCAMTLYHQASLYEEKGDLESAIRCLEQVVAIDEKYGLPKYTENKIRLQKLRTQMNSGSRSTDDLRK
jgi:protein O-GlcNAc transferase